MVRYLPPRTTAGSPPYSRLLDCLFRPGFRNSEFVAGKNGKSDGRHARHRSGTSDLTSTWALDFNLALLVLRTPNVITSSPESPALLIFQYHIGRSHHLFSPGQISQPPPRSTTVQLDYYSSGVASQVPNVCVWGPHKHQQTCDMATTIQLVCLAARMHQCP